MEQVVLPRVDSTLEKSLQMLATQTAFTISNCRQADMPIVYASPGFYELTGYSKGEVLGRNWRFLQGPGTSRHSVLELRNCIQEDRGCTVCMLNYKRDKSPFWNQLCLAPISDNFGVAYYLGIQTNVTGIVLAHQRQQATPFQTPVPGPHGGVHNFTGCPDVVKTELEKAAELGVQIKRWHSSKLEGRGGGPRETGPVSCALLPTSLLAPLYKLHQSFVLADPNLPDTPIVHASAGFLELTGWPRDEVVGRNCRFMQGGATDKAEVAKIRDAIEDKRPVSVRVLNFRYDGTPFWNNLHIAPVRNAAGEVVFFVGVQLDITLAPQPGRGATATAAQNCGGESSGDAEGSASAGRDDLPEPSPTVDPRAKQAQRSVVGTVRVVCRSLSAKAGLRRSLEDQHRPHAVEAYPGATLERKQALGSERIGMPTLGSSHI